MLVWLYVFVVYMGADMCECVCTYVQRHGLWCLFGCLFVLSQDLSLAPGAQISGETVCPVSPRNLLPNSTHRMVFYGVPEDGTLTLMFLLQAFMCVTRLGLQALVWQIS